VTELLLAGCHPEPLGSYLKALGVFRLVGEQADAEAEGWWAGDSFHLRSRLDRDALEEFLLDRYEPTPFVSPWNGGSGFDEKDQQLGIAAIERSAAPRLAAYRLAAQVGRSLVEGDEWRGLSKEDRVRACRSRLPDSAVRWLDAAVVLTNDDRQFPPLLGTGGNVGRLEFSNNVMQRLVDVLALGDGKKSSSRDDSASWIRASLWAVRQPRLLKAAIGQLDPGGAGGANSDPIETSGTSLVNPWDFVLMFEGALMFASGAARRMGRDSSGKAAMPFMVDGTAAGYASDAVIEATKGELWAPLWCRPSTIREFDRLLTEGRSEWRGKQVRTGLDFARSVATLGVDRGIESFVRHVFAERHGQNYLAVPIGRIRARTRDESAVRLLAGLDSFVNAIRRVKEPPAGVRAAVSALDQAQYELAVRSSPGGLQQVLIRAAELSGAVERSASVREKVAPLHLGQAEAWRVQLDDGSPEVQLAFAFASQRNRLSGAAPDWPRQWLRGVVYDRRRLAWSNRAPVVAGLGMRPVADVLADLLAARAASSIARQDLFDSGGESSVSSPVPGQVGVNVAFEFSTAAPVNSVSAYLNGEIDDSRFESLLSGCLLLDFGGARVTPFEEGEDPETVVVHPAFALLAPFFHGRPFTTGRASVFGLLPDRSWPARMRSEVGVASVCGDAVHRLQVARLVPLVRSAGRLASGIDPQRLAASLTFPLSRRCARELLSRVSSTREQLLPISGGSK